MRICDLHDKNDDYIISRIDENYKINKGIILEDGFNSVGFILYNIENNNSNKIAHIDYLFIEEESYLETILNKYEKKMKYNNINMILNHINFTNIELINQYIDYKYKIFNITNNNTKIILYKNL